MALSLEDRAAIEEIYAAYAHTFDAGDAYGWAALFTPDGRFVRRGEEDVVGTAALQQFVLDRAESAPGITHHVTNVSMAAADDGARGRAYVFVLRIAPGAVLRLRNLGAYEDDLVQDNGVWRIAERRFTSWLAPEGIDAPFSFGPAR